MIRFIVERTTFFPRPVFSDGRITPLVTGEFGHRHGRVDREEATLAHIQDAT
jgi:hypothetical protein